MTLQTGQVLNNRYRIVKLLGKGGFGAVYRAWDVNFELPCALKENNEVSSAAQRQFIREARILHTLRHPNLPLVKDYFFIPDQGQYLVMDYIEGEDLQKLLNDSAGPLSEKDVVRWLSFVCLALEYMHTQSHPVIHRDIKPANIKITPKGEAILVDFGISKLLDPNTPTTLGAQAVTPGFSPFEQYGHATTDARTDIYALGATAYTLLTAQTPPESISRLTGVELKAPSLFNPNISSPVEAAIIKAMQLSPDDRYDNALEFRQELERMGEKSDYIGDISTETVFVNISPTTQGSEDTPYEESLQDVSISGWNNNQSHVQQRNVKKAIHFWKYAILVGILLGFVAAGYFIWQGYLSERFQIAPIPEEKEVVKNISGEWHGFVEQIGGEHRFNEIFVVFEQMPDSDEIGCHIEVILEPELIEPRGCGGDFNGRIIHFVDEKDQTYWGIIEAGRIVGETSWGCMECEPWGRFELER